MLLYYTRVHLMEKCCSPLRRTESLASHCKVSQLCLTTALCSGNFSIKVFIAFFLNEKITNFSPQNINQYF